MPAPDLETFKVVTTETSSATKFNNLVQAVEDEFSDIDPDQISGYPSDATKVLLGNGTWAVPPSSGTAVAMVGTPVTTSAEIISTTSELSMKTAGAAGNTTGWLIPGGTIGTTKLITLKAHGDYLQNTAGNLRFRVYLRDGAGANTLLWDDTIANTNVGASRIPWDMDVFVAALASASSQIMWGSLNTLRAQSGAPTAGIGNLAFEAVNDFGGGVFADDAASSVSMASDRYLDVTVTPSASSASLAWRLKYATMTVTG